MVRTYFKILLIILIAYQTTTKCSFWENVKNNIPTNIPVTLLISSAIAGGTYYECCNLRYPGEAMALFGVFFAALKPFSQLKGMPFLYSLKENEIFKTYQYTFTLAFLGAAFAALAYHNVPPVL